MSHITNETVTSSVAAESVQELRCADELFLNMIEELTEADQSCDSRPETEGHSWMDYKVETGWRM